MSILIGLAHETIFNAVWASAAAFQRYLILLVVGEIPPKAPPLGQRHYLGGLGL